MGKSEEKEVWEKLLNPTRFSSLLGREKVNHGIDPPSFAEGEARLPAERDYDRILFSTPLRRMGDKTQVFPLESIESIRTRLTHSYEVSNLARSIGVDLAAQLEAKLPDDARRVVPSILAAAGLAHDIGNPPFGHQGENAIRAWFIKNKSELFTPGPKENDPKLIGDLAALTDQHRQDFLKFEGNAQTLRVLTKLQVIGDDLGLNLSVGTIAALMKYISPSHKTDKNQQALKKVGFFTSEASLVGQLRKEVGLKGNARHPLALIMEACDDIAYSVLDAEDSIKKGLVSFNDLIAWLDRKLVENNDSVIQYVMEVSKWEHEQLARRQLHPGELVDVSTQKFRLYAIHVMVTAVIEAFIRHYPEILSGDFDGELIKESAAGRLCSVLKEFDRKNAFSHRSVLEVELKGYNTINRLMDYLWIGISQREDYEDVASNRKTPFSAYVYSRISRNYRRVFEGDIENYHTDPKLPIRYRELQLLTDMVSGMTDRFCIELHDDFARYHTDAG